MPEVGGPRFSVIVAVRDAVSTLQACIDSVSGQRDGSVELIVIDGGSTDGTVALIERNEAAIAYHVSGPDDGICDAWNKALPHARGQWLLFLGADDRFASDDVLRTVAASLDGLAPDRRIAYGRVEVESTDGRILETQGRPWVEAAVDFRRHNTLPHQGVFHHRSVFERHGPFRRDFRILGDYELLLRELKDHEPVFLDLVVARMGAGGLSAREESAWQATREAYRAQHANGLAALPEWLSFRIIRATAFELVRRTFGLGAARGLADAYHRVAGR
jgi:glycosyltransferase involved in cell wall biosynthesis